VPTQKSKVVKVHKCVLPQKHHCQNGGKRGRS
jgi:hypothetical protein